jgi:hypothetical protein
VGEGGRGAQPDSTGGYDRAVDQASVYATGDTEQLREDAANVKAASVLRGDFMQSHSTPDASAPIAGEPIHPACS